MGPRGNNEHYEHDPFATCSWEVTASMSIGIERSRQDEARVSGSFNGDQYMFVTCKRSQKPITSYLW